MSSGSRMVISCFIPCSAGAEALTLPGTLRYVMFKPDTVVTRRLTASEVMLCPPEAIGSGSSKLMEGFLFFLSTERFEL